MTDHTHEPAEVPMMAIRVKPLDLSNLLKHAFTVGWEKSESTSSSMEYMWTEYDPTESAAYARIMAAIELAPDPRDAVIAQLVRAAQIVCIEYYDADWNGEPLSMNNLDDAIAAVKVGMT